MKKVITMFLFLSCLTTALYSQEISEKEGKKVLEQIRREIQAEEKAKQKAIEDAEKAKAEEEKARIAAEDVYKRQIHGDTSSPAATSIAMPGGTLDTSSISNMTSLYVQGATGASTDTTTTLKIGASGVGV